MGVVERMEGARVEAVSSQGSCSSGCVDGDFSMLLYVSSIDNVY